VPKARGQLQCPALELRRIRPDSCAEIQTGLECLARFRSGNGATEHSLTDDGCCLRVEQRRYNDDVPSRQLSPEASREIGIVVAQHELQRDVGIDASRQALVPLISMPADSFDDVIPAVLFT
jgi:hypothetical protein